MMRHKRNNGSRWILAVLALSVAACGSGPAGADNDGPAEGETCGNGEVESAEECDLGEANSDDGFCTTTCTLQICGDGLLGTEEECDLGEGNSDETADTCRTDCRLPFCGDGVLDYGEQCEPPGEQLDNGTCTAGCQIGCAAGRGDCDGSIANACETDLLSDTAHCGECGHDCGGGACTSGVCAPLQIADVPAYNTSIYGMPVLRPHGGHLYTSHHTGLMRVAMTAEELVDPEVFEAVQPFFAAFVVTDEGVYFSGRNGLTSATGLFLADLTTGIPQLVTSEAMPMSLAADETHLYFGDGDGDGQTRLERLARGGTTLELVAVFRSGVCAHSLCASPFPMLVDTGHIYLGYLSDAPIWRVTKDPAAPEPIPIGEVAEVWELATNDSHIYWPAASVSATSGVLRMARDPFACHPEPFCAEESVSTTTGKSFGIGLDETHVYWVEFDTGILARRPLDGGLTEILLVGLSSPKDVVVTDFIYWLDAPTGGPASVWKMAKPVE